MMKIADKATEIFQNGFNCAQAVLSAFGPELGLERELCFKIGTPFGAGLARKQEVCGAVAGALMVIGLKFGRTSKDDVSVKENAYGIARDFIQAFESRNSSIICRSLLGCDMNTTDGQKEIEEKNLFGTLCVKYVKDAVEILEKLVIL